MKALVVDDDFVLADLIAFTLQREGYEVVQAFDGPSALRKWEEEQPDIIILDVNLPRTVPPLDGFTIAQRIREQADTPIILLTVRADEDDIVRGLKLGADDYVLKPFSPRQLVARMEAVLRRAGKDPAPAVRQLGRLAFDPGRRLVQVGQAAAQSLTPLEARLLDVLTRNAGQVVPNETIIDHVWGPAGGDGDMLRQLVRRLRKKIEIDPAHPQFIETVAGLGYGIAKQE